MRWTKEAIKLMKKFASGVDCPEWDEETIDKTMFHPYCEEIAEKVNRSEIDAEVVKFYIFKVHNQMTARIGKIGKEGIEAIKNCMVRPQKTETGWICIHGTAKVMLISQDEAENLERDNQKLLKSL
jgi:hypothetical protein